MTAIHFTQDSDFSAKAKLAMSGLMCEDELIKDRQLSIVEMMGRYQRQQVQAITIDHLVRDVRFDNESLADAKKNVMDAMTALYERGVFVPAPFVLTHCPQMTVEFAEFVRPVHDEPIKPVSVLTMDRQLLDEAYAICTLKKTLPEIDNMEGMLLFHMVHQNSLGNTVVGFTNLVNFCTCYRQHGNMKQVADEVTHVLIERGFVKEEGTDENRVFRLSDELNEYVQRRRFGEEQPGFQSQVHLVLDASNVPYMEAFGRQTDFGIMIKTPLAQMHIDQFLDHLGDHVNGGIRTLPLESTLPGAALLMQLYMELRNGEDVLVEFNSRFAGNRTRDRDPVRGVAGRERGRFYRDHDRDSDRYSRDRDYREREREHRGEGRYNEQHARRDRFLSCDGENRSNWTPEARLTRLESIVETLMRESGRGPAKFTTAGLSVEERLDHLEHLTAQIQLRNGDYSRGVPTRDGWENDDRRHDGRGRNRY